MDGPRPRTWVRVSSRPGAVPDRPDRPTADRPVVDHGFPSIPGLPRGPPWLRPASPGQRTGCSATGGIGTTVGRRTTPWPDACIPSCGSDGLPDAPWESSCQLRVTALAAGCCRRPSCARRSSSAFPGSNGGAPPEDVTDASIPSPRLQADADVHAPGPRSQGRDSPPAVDHTSTVSRQLRKWSVLRWRRGTRHRRRWHRPRNLDVDTSEPIHVPRLPSLSGVVLCPSTSPGIAGIGSPCPEDRDGDRKRSSQLLDHSPMIRLPTAAARASSPPLAKVKRTSSRSETWVYFSSGRGA